MLLFAVSNDGAGPPLVYEASGSVDAATPRSQSGRKKKASRERERVAGLARMQQARCSEEISISVFMPRPLDGPVLSLNVFILLGFR